MADFASADLSLAVAQAVSWLTRPLIFSYSATTIIKLQFILEANLTALFAPTWCSKDPLRGSGRRCLTFSPDRLPARSIYSACLATGVQWFDWMTLLGGREFDFFVNPGSVAVRFGLKSSGAKLYTVWSDQPQPHSYPESHTASVASVAAAPIDDEDVWFQGIVAARAAAATTQGKTFEQQLREDDEAEREIIFSMLADEVTDPTWTPLLDQFPMPPPLRSSSPLSTASTHSRSSSSCSYSSISSAGFSSSSVCSTSPSTSFHGSHDSVDNSSFVSSSAPAISAPAATVAAPGLPARSPPMSRKERARHGRVFVDHSKSEVTPYDGGKTTVLTGGVMLGAPAPAPRNQIGRPAMTPAWRSARG